MAKRGLTANEKQVLYGLVRHATLNDRELSDALGVKVSTVTAIRRRLRRADYFVTRRIPMMHRVGWEILTAGHARLDLTQGAQAGPRLREVLKEKVPGLFHVAVSPDHLSFLGFARDYTRARIDVDELRLGLDHAKLLGDGDVAFSAFPMALSTVPSFFDYSHPLALLFELEDRFSIRMDRGKTGDISLSRKETDVFKGLVRFPELSDKALAQRVKVSRQAVSKMRREFEAEGLVRTARIPNLQRLGFDLYVSAFARFVPSSTVKGRTDAVERLLRTAPVPFLISDDAEASVVAAAKTFEQFTVLRSTITKHLQERGFLQGDPEVHVALTSTTEILRNCEFGPLVQTLTAPEPASSR